MNGILAATIVTGLLSQVAVATMDTSTRFESEDGFTRMSRSDDGPSPVWTVQQQPLSCGVVWFNQNEGAMSQYDMLDIIGSEGCGESGNAGWAGMFQVEETAVAQWLFESVCNGEMDLSWLPRNLHMELTSDDVQGGLRPPTFNAEAMTFMIVRNTCLNPINVIVSQAVAVNFIVHVTTLMKVCTALTAGLLAMALVLTSLIVYMAVQVGRSRQGCSEEDDAESCNASPTGSAGPERSSPAFTMQAVAKMFRIRSLSTPTHAEERISAQCQPLLSAKDESNY